MSFIIVAKNKGYWLNEKAIEFGGSAGWFSGFEMSLQDGRWGDKCRLFPADVIVILIAECCNTCMPTRRTWRRLHRLVFIRVVEFFSDFAMFFTLCV